MFLKKKNWMKIQFVQNLHKLLTMEKHTNTSFILWQLLLQLDIVLIPVSYTHLDVYKRQIVLLTKFVFRRVGNICYMAVCIIISNLNKAYVTISFTKNEFRGGRLASTSIIHQV